MITKKDVHFIKTPNNYTKCQVYINKPMLCGYMGFGNTEKLAITDLKKRFINEEKRISVLLDQIAEAIAFLHN